jgi:hypothetical protein
VRPARESLPEPTPVDTPIVVFLSSHQKEFADLRISLKDAIDAEDVFGKLLMKAELVEKRSGTTISGDIEQALANSNIYLGIFGKMYSTIAVREYRVARKLGLPIVMFEIATRQKAISDGDPKVKDFLDRVKKVDGVRVITLTVKRSSPGEFLGVITQRICNTIAEIANQNLRIRKVLNPA